ncbi:hypothetical protein [Nocardiopsis sp. NPDC058789]|uniref:hypothetical protein n=1 Tax=Nocardiopsis sp. NPDC058789 TaxID=3346634 RepID=UPI00366E4369
MTSTCHCGRPTGDDAYVCTGCADQARTALRTIMDGLDADLTVTLAKQGSKPESAGGGHGKKSEAPLPLDLRAVEARSVLRNTLVTWVRLIHDDGRSASALPADTLPSMASWLFPAVGWLRGRDYGSEFVDEITAAVAQALRVVDSPQRTVFVCRCTCGEHVYARENAPAATCPGSECGTVWGVTEQRAWMLQNADGQLLGASDMARAVSRPNDPVSASTIRSWARRNKLTKYNPDGGPLRHGEMTKVPLYKVSEVLALVLARAGQQEARMVA